MLRVNYAQLNYQLGDVNANFELIQQAIERAIQQDSDILVFSELSLTGYFPADLLQQTKFIKLVNTALNQLLVLSRQYPNLHLVIGAPIETKQQKSQKTILTNQLLVINNGQILLSYAKQLLLTDKAFYDASYFSPGQEPAPTLTINDIKIGFLFGQDCVNEQIELYENNILTQLQKDNIDLLITINASASYLGIQQRRQDLFKNIAKQFNFALLWVNQVGAFEQIVYDGSSFALDKNGNLVHQSKSFVTAEQQLYFDGANWLTAQQQLCPIINVVTPNKYQQIQQQISLGLIDYMRRSGFTKVVVGSSGGIDSALTICLATQAIGAENVHAITMPSRHSSTGSITDSQQLCSNLQVSLDQHPIESIVQLYSQEFTNNFNQPLQGIALENLQARIRANILMSYANKNGHLVLTTGNKSEIAVGYCTLYGDTCGGLNLIGDLYKTEVFELANYINQQAGKELIPSAIINKEPSAELAPQQKDSDSLPPYSILDPILLYLLEFNSLDKVQQQQIEQQFKTWKQSANSNAILTRVKTLLQYSEFKRFQAPPLIHLRKNAFGSGRQMPIVAKHCY